MIHSGLSGPAGKKTRKKRSDPWVICSLLRIQKKKNCTSEGSYSYAEEEHIP